MGAPGDKTTALPTAALADEILVNSGGTTSRMTALAVATQFASIAAVSPTIASIATLGTAAGKMLYTTAPNTWAEWSISAAARSILDDTSVDAIRATLFVGDFLTVATLVTDWNSPTTGGRYMGNAAAHGPDGTNWYIGGQDVHNASYAVEEVVGFTQFNEANTAKYARAKQGGTWTPWVRLYQSATEIKGLVNAIGVGQTWQNLTASRALATAYQNTTGRSIMVSVTVDGTAGTPAKVQTSADGSTWVEVSGFTEAAWMHAQIIVPPGHYYRVYGGDGLKGWSELR